PELFVPTQPPPPASPLLPYTTLFRSRVPPGTRVIYSDLNAILLGEVVRRVAGEPLDVFVAREVFAPLDLHQTMFRPPSRLRRTTDRKSTRLNSSHVSISYAVFCLKKK